MEKSFQSKLQTNILGTIINREFVFFFFFVSSKHRKMEWNEKRMRMELN